MNSNDIAKLAGVSRSTVSRVINNYKNVPEETRARVLEVIKKYNYVPHASARALAGVKSKTIGLFLIDKKSCTAGHKVSMSTYFIPFIGGIIDGANKNGYNVLVYAVGKADDYENVRNVFYNKTISGGIFIGQTNDDEITEIAESNFKTVLIDRQYGSTEKKFKNSIIVNADNFNGAYEATKYLINLGHTKIAHVTGYSGQLSTIDRLSGYKAALEESGIDVDPNLIVKGDFMREGGYNATKKLLSQSSPTAIFYGNDAMAIGGLKALNEMGVNVPDDISIVGFDDIEVASYISPSLTTIRLPLDAMSDKAINLLINSIETDTDYCANYVMPVKLIERNSCRRI
ncbi:LacI family transcriptional regulator [[Clostridium] cellulosi]|jgi:transcriptional regulator, LacI family|uniref:LacI family transcriptional regulator n=1 Tax=[Clostridium] cellulosi TaxID=29343 RepID=A0A078KJX9_9FIRM|nr:LacI family transcriptional regulator [[Clostridium] cellulosi]